LPPLVALYAAVTAATPHDAAAAAITEAFSPPHARHAHA